MESISLYASRCLLLGYLIKQTAQFPCLVKTKNHLRKDNIKFIFGTLGGK